MAPAQPLPQCKCIEFARRAVELVALPVETKEPTATSNGKPNFAFVTPDVADSDPEAEVGEPVGVSCPGSGLHVTPTAAGMKCTKISVKAINPEAAVVSSRVAAVSVVSRKLKTPDKSHSGCRFRRERLQDQGRS